MKDFPKEWTTPSDELYIIEKVWPDTEVLATSISEKTGDLHPVIWTHKYGKARVFGTTYGHANETFEDKVFLDVVINGVKWATSSSSEFSQWSMSVLLQRLQKFFDLCNVFPQLGDLLAYVRRNCRNINTFSAPSMLSGFAATAPGEVAFACNFASVSSICFRCSSDVAAGRYPDRRVSAGTPDNGF